MNKLKLALNIDKLESIFHSSLFTDITIKFCDYSKNEVIFHAHRSILYASCSFFETMFTTKLVTINATNTTDTTDTTDTTITKIIVPNALVCYDIICSFYGFQSKTGDLPDWLYELELIKCQDYFGLKISDLHLKDFTIPAKYFPLVLSTAHILMNNNYNKYDIMNFILRNAPTDFNPDDLGSDIKSLIINSSKECILVIFRQEKVVNPSYTNRYDYNVVIYDSRMIYIIDELKELNKYTKGVDFLIAFPKNNKIIIYDCQSRIIIYNLLTNKIVISDQLYFLTDEICFINDNELIILDQDYNLHKLLITDENCLFDNDFRVNLCYSDSLSLSEDKTKLISITGVTIKQMISIDLTTKAISSAYKYNNASYNQTFIFDESSFIAFNYDNRKSNKTFDIIDTNGEIIRKINCPTKIRRTDDDMDFFVSPDKRYVIMTENDFLKIIDLQKELLVNSIALNYNQNLYLSTHCCFQTNKIYVSRISAVYIYDFNLLIKGEYDKYCLIDVTNINDVNEIMDVTCFNPIIKKLI